jgi:hypothetical protein
VGVIRRVSAHDLSSSISEGRRPEEVKTRFA